MIYVAQKRISEHYSEMEIFSRQTVASLISDPAQFRSFSICQASRRHLFPLSIETLCQAVTNEFRVRVRESNFKFAHFSLLLAVYLL